MKVILLKSVPKVGKTGDIVEVSDGYAANALFPRKLAIPATSTNLASLEKKSASEKAQKALQHELLEKAIASLPNETVIIPARANEKGSLFSRIDAEEIVKALEQHRIVISPKNIVLDHPIKEIGTYTLHVKEGVYAKSIQVAIVPQK